MINLKAGCIEFLKNQDTRRDIQDILACITDLVYNEIYSYIWLICVYIIFLIFLILANLILLMQIYYNQRANKEL